MKGTVYINKKFNNNIFTCKNDYNVRTKSNDNRITCIDQMICIHTCI